MRTSRSTRPSRRPRASRPLLAVLAATALLLTGCTADGRGPDKDGVITLRFQSLAWQKESVDINKQLVREWNAAHPKVQVRYVQGSWDSVHDQLLTSFEGGEAPDIIHDASDDLADFSYGGYLADLTGLVPDRLKADIPRRSWDTATFDKKVYGVPFLQEPRVLIANEELLKASGVRFPTPAKPWSWDEFRQVTKKLTADMAQADHRQTDDEQAGDKQTDHKQTDHKQTDHKQTGDKQTGGKRYGVAWPLKEPVSATLNLGLSAGGALFHRGDDGKVTVRFTDADAVVPATVREQVNTDGSASAATLGMGGSDTLPGFFGGKYAMVPLGFSFRQQVSQQAPDGFPWTVLPAPAGRDGLTQGVSPQTLSVAEDTPYKKEAVEFIDFFLQPENMVRLAKGDWMLPTGTEALGDPSLRTGKDGWATGTALAARLLPAPAQSVRGYPEWKDKVATPAYQEYYSGAIDADRLRQRLEEDGNLVLARYQR